MRITNISNNINFGKTVRVNMSVEDAFKLTSCLNAKNAQGDELELQKEAKAIFDDTDKGGAVFCANDNGKFFYILTGNEAKKLKEIKKNALNALEAIGVFYEDGPFADKNIEYICKKENRDISNLIRNTREKFVLTIFKDRETGLPKLSKFSIIG